MAGYARYDDSFDEEHRRLVYGVLYDIGPALRIQDIEGLIKQCFQFRYFEMYAGLADGEAFFAVDQDEFDHLEKSLVIYDGDIKIKRLHQKVLIYRINLPNERKNAFLKRCLTIAGIEAVDRDHVKCCDYQLKLIYRFLSTQGSKLADPTKILTSIEADNDNDSDEEGLLKRYEDSEDLDFLDLEPTPNRRLTPKSFYAQMDEPDHEHRSAAASSSSSSQYSSNNANQNKKFEFKITYDHTFSHNGNLRSQNGLSIIVKEADLCQMNVDCLLNYFLVDTDIMDIVSNQLGEKAGLAYQVELTTQISTRSLRKSSSSDECMLFHTSSGRLANCKHVIQLGQRYVDSSNLAKKFKSLFNAYLQLFDYVESSLRVKSLAIRMIGDNEDRDLSIISLIEALNQYYFHKTVCLKSNVKIRQHANLRELYIVCLDPLPLMVLQEYLTNGFQADFLSQLFEESSDNENMSEDDDEESETIVHKDTATKQESRRTITEADYDYGDDDDEDDDLDTLQAKLLSLNFDKNKQSAQSAQLLDTSLEINRGDACVKCQKIGELAFVTWDKSRLYNHLIDFKGCLAAGRGGRGSCEICTIFANLLKINIKELLTTSTASVTFDPSVKSCVCLKCYFEMFIDKLCKSHCSSCLREMNSQTSDNDNANKQCRKHSICVKCSFLPKNMSLCYYCTVFKLYHTMFDHVNTSSHHDNIDCCFDYLDYELMSADKTVAGSKKKMACGHMAFPEDLALRSGAACLSSAEGQSQQKAAAPHHVCGFCTMTKLTNMVLSKQTSQVDYEIVDDLDIEEDQEEIEEDEEEDRRRQQQQQQVSDDDLNEAEEETTEASAATSHSHRDHNNNNNKVQDNESAIFTHIKYLAEPLPGHPNINTIELQFFIPNGVQKATDPRPGERYLGMVKSCYLPGNRQGKELSRLISQMLDNDKLITVVKTPDGKAWVARFNNRVELKTSKTGGIYNNGYPDEGYLDRLEKQLQSL